MKLTTARTASFCSYRSYRFNELVYAHYFREDAYPPFALLREYFKRATENALRNLTRSQRGFVNV